MCALAAGNVLTFGIVEILREVEVYVYIMREAKMSVEVKVLKGVKVTLTSEFVKRFVPL